MTTNSQHSIRRAAAMIALVSIVTVAAQAMIAEHALAASQSVSFEVSSPAIGFTAAILSLSSAYVFSVQVGA